jgi:hypothetical protein
MYHLLRYFEFLFWELLMIKRAPRQPRHRTRLPNSFQPTVPPLNWTATIVATKARLTLSLPYSIGGLPTGITVQGVAPTAITQVSSLVFDLTYPSSVVSTNVLVVPGGVPQIRGAAGGTLAAGTFTFP